MGRRPHCRHTSLLAAVLTRPAGVPHWGPSRWSGLLTSERQLRRMSAELDRPRDIPAGGSPPRPGARSPSGHVDRSETAHGRVAVPTWRGPLRQPTKTVSRGLRALRSSRGRPSRLPRASHRPAAPVRASLCGTARRPAERPPPFRPARRPPRPGGPLWPASLGRRHPWSRSGPPVSNAGGVQGVDERRHRVRVGVDHPARRQVVIRGPLVPDCAGHDHGLPQDKFR